MAVILCSKAGDPSVATLIALFAMETATRVLGVIKGEFNTTDGYLPAEQLQRIRESGNANVLETETSPIGVIGVEEPQPYQIQVRIPNGFEYDLAEIAQAAVLKGTGDIKFDWTGAHSSLARIARHPGN